MPGNIESVTRAALALALDAASLRQQVIATNIANQGIDGYVQHKVNFAAQLEGVRRNLDARGTLNPDALAEVRPRIEPVLDAQGKPTKVQLDTEVADMAQNAVHYQALARALNRHFSILSSAASDGKR